jgi:hypothetical protein
MDITGHKTDEMFYRYNKNDHDDAVETVGKFEQKLSELGNVEQGKKNTLQKEGSKCLKPLLLTWCRRGDLNSHRETPTRP